MTFEPTNDLARAHVGIVWSLPLEAAPFVARCERVSHYSGNGMTFRGGWLGDIRVAIVESGTGFARARQATQALIDGHEPAWILSAGISGSVRDSVRIGDIVVASSLTDTHGNTVDAPINMPEQSGLHTGRFVTADQLVRTVAEKKQLGQQFDAIAVDTCSLAVAQVARDAGKRFLSIRAIANDTSADLPREVLTLIGDSTSSRIGAAAASIWQRPGSIKDIWRLRENAIHATENLAVFLDGVIQQLGQQP